ncbi:MAG TPA: alpha/beta hydrolase [Candidatus Methylomirabilis sp.]|nr:alpha/beta hydrolase [Candidatus Methylomirabilis sp.]
MAHPTRPLLVGGVWVANTAATAALALVIGFVANRPAIAWAEMLKEIDSPRPGVKLRMLIEKGQQPKAAVILLPGALGALNISTFFGTAAPGKQLENNFLVRTRKDFAMRGFITVLVDTPSDKPSGMPPAFRISRMHVTDLTAIVQYLKQEYGVPVWVAGTSRGTISAARMLVDSPPELAGGILTASIVQSDEKWSIFKSHPDVILNMPLGRTLLPVLVVHHKNDGCAECPPQKAERLKGKFQNSKQFVFMWIEGGSPDKSGPCEGLAAHGFYGKEDRVLDTMAEFIKANT